MRGGRTRPSARTAAVVAVLVVGAIVTVAAARHGPHGHAAPTARTVAARTILAAHPDVGVACPIPNSTACDRVGVAVRLRHPARRVVAAIGGHRAILYDRRWSGPARHGLRRAFVGFVHPAGLRPGTYAGNRPIATTLHLIVTDADGVRHATSLRVNVGPGWGGSGSV